MTGLRFLLRTFAWLAVLPYAVVLVIVATGSPTWSGAAYVVGLGILLAGLATLPKASLGSIPLAGEEPVSERPTRRPRGVARGALAGLVAIAFVRACTAESGSSLHVVKATRGAPSSARFVDRIVDESDLAVNGTRVLVATGMLQDDADELPGAMRDAYARMREAEGDAPSPFLATYLGLQGKSGFDLVVVDLPSHASPKSAVLFLHGFAGNFDLPCFQIARALSDLDVVSFDALGRRLVVCRGRGDRSSLRRDARGARRLADRARGSVEWSHRCVASRAAHARDVRQRRLDLRRRGGSKVGRRSDARHPRNEGHDDEREPRTWLRDEGRRALRRARCRALRDARPCGGARSSFARLRCRTPWRSAETGVSVSDVPRVGDPRKRLGEATVSIRAVLRTGGRPRRFRCRSIKRGWRKVWRFSDPFFV